ncbi:serine/threonine-protein kinase [Streptomyces edwardsiae]|uniref:Secreted protein n=1 Tax=Streptomyces edwardsiae TaxID=3075527 RepID=A0ABU2QP67_9ACTN|nr:hypothetical protein [Streptomyces sp. DSM 41635]MDT0405826.1 hypothetical protein [Streptomyces sp. DSM 41635]
MPGTVLLVAAAPLGRGRLVDAASVLPVLAAVPPAVLSGTDTANVVELADPLEPQAVLTRLRAAAAAPGPLTVYVTGQLQLDRRQRLPHLALARTTASTVRYTALPWQWFREELRLRPAGATTLFLDLHADAETWQWLCAPRPPGPSPLDCGRDNTVYGRVAPPPSRRGVAAPAYMKAVATILRSGRRPPDEELHQQALTRIAPESAGTDLLLAQRGPLPGDPHAAVTAAVRSGRHGDADALAARLEQAARLAHGPASEEALHWTEVRADLAMLAGDAARSCRSWLAVATTRLTAGQPADAPAVESAVDRAHHQWGRIGDPVRARELGPVLAELRGRVPGRREGALDHVRAQLRQLQTQG